MATSAWTPATPSKPVEKNDLTCTVYALKELGDDPALGKWIAETIPQVIQPGTWCKDDASPPMATDRKQRLCYYPQGKVLVVYHTAAAQAEVTAFLDSLKKAMPSEKERTAAMHDGKLMRTAFASTAPAPLRSPDVVGSPQGAGYPIPTPLQHPKHLFHMIVKAEGLGELDASALLKELANAASSEDAKDQGKSESKGLRLNPAITFILRYEGEGIIDSTVADVLKEIYGAKNAAKNEGGCPAPRYAPGSVEEIPVVPTPSRPPMSKDSLAPTPSSDPLPPPPPGAGPAPAPGSTPPLRPVSPSPSSSR